MTIRRDLRPVTLVCECDCWCIAIVYRGAVDRRPEPVPDCDECRTGRHVASQDDDVAARGR